MIVIMIVTMVMVMALMVMIMIMVVMTALSILSLLILSGSGYSVLEFNVYGIEDYSMYLAIDILSESSELFTFRTYYNMTS